MAALLHRLAADCGFIRRLAVRWCIVSATLTASLRKALGGPGLRYDAAWLCLGAGHAVRVINFLRPGEGSDVLELIASDPAEVIGTCQDCPDHCEWLLHSEIESSVNQLFQNSLCMNVLVPGWQALINGCGGFNDYSRTVYSLNRLGPVKASKERTHISFVPDVSAIAKVYTNGLHCVCLHCKVPFHGLLVSFCFLKKFPAKIVGRLVAIPPQDIQHFTCVVTHISFLQQLESGSSVHCVLLHYWCQGVSSYDYRDLPTPEPTSTPEPTPTPLPTATPHPSTYCREWEALVLEWVRDGNVYDRLSLRLATDSSVPDHPNLTVSLADDLYITDFPWGRHGTVWYELKVGTGEGQLLPGTYRYRSKTGDDRVSVRDCTLSRNFDQYYDAELAIELPYGEPFEFTFHTYHNVVWFGGCGGFLYRVGD